MKLDALILVGLTTGSLALVARPPATVAKRDLATINAVLGPVGQGIDRLDAAIRGFDVAALNSESDQLVATIRDGQAKVQASQTLSISDAVGVQTPVQAIQTKSETLVADMKTRKPDFQTAGLCEIVRQKIAGIATESGTLSDGIVAKVPSIGQRVAKNVVAKLKAVLDDANTQFSSQNCVNTGGAGVAVPAPAAGAGAAPVAVPIAVPVAAPVAAPAVNPAAAPAAAPVSAAPPAADAVSPAVAPASAGVAGVAAAPALAGNSSSCTKSA